MVKQKLNRKVFATTTGAALVATAIVPAAVSAAELNDFESVPEYAKEAVKYLADNDFLQGDENGNFDALNSINRASAAEVLRKAQGLTVDGTEDYTDVEVGDWYYDSVRAVSPEIFDGYNGLFSPKDNLTREQAAKVIVEAYGLAGSAELTFEDSESISGWAEGYVETAVANGIVEGKDDGTFAPQENVDRASFAVMVKRAIDATTAPSVVSVSAINAMTVEVTGQGLSNLTADNFSLEGNTVTSYNVDAETGVATLTFEEKVESGKENILTLTEQVEGEDDKVSEFTFTYTLEVNSVTANSLTVDNDTPKQNLSFKLNEGDMDADVSYLNASGYSVEFQATTDVFVGGTTSSATGELAASLTPDSTFAYKVVVSDVDGNVVAESALAEVKVIDKAGVVTAIDSFDVTNGTINLSSNTVVLGESFAIKNVVGDKADGTNDTSLADLVEFTSSNKNVALVDSSGNILPIKAGTSTITVKSGDVTKSFTLTVATEARVAKASTLTSSSLKLVEGKANGSVGIVVEDQYGDAVSGLDLSAETYETTQVDVNGTLTDIVSVTGTITDSKGEAELTVTPDVAGNGTVKVKVASNEIATLSVAVSGDTVAATRELELADASQDTNLDIYTGEENDTTVDFKYNLYNANGFLLGAETDIDTAGATKYTASIVEASGDIADVSVVTGGVISVTAKADAGTAYLVIKEGSVVREKLAVTVVNSTPTISAVTLKSADKVTEAAVNITASSVVTLKDDSQTDKIVENISLTSATDFAIRLDETSGDIYIDSDGSGTYTPDNTTTGVDETELVVGNVSITENIQATATATTIATTSGDNGSVVYSVSDSSSNVIATSVVDVEVN